MKHRTGRAELLSELVKFESYQLLLGEDLELSNCWILVLLYIIVFKDWGNVLCWSDVFVLDKERMGGTPQIDKYLESWWLICCRRGGCDDGVCCEGDLGQKTTIESICRCSYNRHQEELPRATSKPHWELSLAATRRTWRRCYALKWVKDGKASV